MKYNIIIETINGTEVTMYYDLSYDEAIFQLERILSTIHNKENEYSETLVDAYLEEVEDVHI